MVQHFVIISSCKNTSLAHVVIAEPLQLHMQGENDLRMGGLVLVCVV